MRTSLSLLAFSWATLVAVLLLLRFMNEELGGYIPLLVAGLVLIFLWAAGVYRLAKSLEERMMRKVPR
ncbi:hypothetical protein GCM10007981_06630 [Thermocladium modestius]|uniref:Uncharacterized protein n=1 Tax=Thermocladium modestius TaxID=62609 RepID=A0A830GX83_9CREN|nr:hypothetical protein [Thermocladium modestius]GGP20064.1 hypothetical protein GCM10007981_06630 [Thermocladium modestius]